MKIQDIVKVAVLTLVAAALMPIRANANPGDIYVSIMATQLFVAQSTITLPMGRGEFLPPD